MKNDFNPENTFKLTLVASATPIGFWFDIDFFSNEEFGVLANSNRCIFRTKKGRLFVTKRLVDNWLIDKYQLDKFLILPE